MEIVHTRLAEVFTDDWRPIPFFPEHQINSQRWIRKYPTLDLMPQHEFSGKYSVLLREESSPKARRYNVELIWKLATATPSELSRLELRIRPREVYHNLLADVLASFQRAGSIEGLKGADRLGLLKLLLALKDQETAPKVRVASIEAMRRIAHGMESHFEDSESGDDGSDE